MSQSHICWSCKGPVTEESFFCETCGCLLMPKKLSPFKMFGVSPQFDLNTNDLEATYLKLQSQFHPDKFVQKSVQEQMNALSWGATLNDAFDTLTHKVQLACALLELNGIHDVLSEKTTPDMMMKQFELRERIEEETDLKAFLAEVNNNITSVEISLLEAFKNANFTQAKQLTVELQFLTKFTKDIKKRIRQNKTKI